MDDVRNDVAKLMNSKNNTSAITPTESAKKVYYRVRKSWSDVKS